MINCNYFDQSINCLKLLQLPVRIRRFSLPYVMVNLIFWVCCSDKARHLKMSRFGSTHDALEQILTSLTPTVPELTNSVQVQKYIKFNGHQNMKY